MPSRFYLYAGIEDGLYEYAIWAPSKKVADQIWTKFISATSDTTKTNGRSMTAKKIKVTRWECTCKQCGFEWQSRDENKPRVCGRCKSHLWEEGKKKPKA
jgi:predicted Zn-ribbon and HTH transcriptional regulator